MVLFADLPCDLGEFDEGRVKAPQQARAARVAALGMGRPRTAASQTSFVSTRRASVARSVGSAASNGSSSA